MSVKPNQSVDLTHRILCAVADAEGVHPIDLDPPLYDVLDGDLLDALLESNRDSVDGSSLQIKFTYHGYEIVVDAAGTVSIDTA